MRGGRVQARFTLAQPEVAGSRVAAAPPRAEPPPQRPPERTPVVAERVHVADRAPLVQERAPSAADRAPLVQERAPAVVERAVAPPAERAVAAATERAFEKPKGTGKVPGWIDKLLLAARSAAASDVHVVADRAALVRVGGDLQSRDEPLDAAAVEAAVVEIVPARLWPTLQEH